MFDSVVPCLSQEFVNPSMVPFVLPNVLKIAEWSSNEEYVQHVLPYLRDVMKLREPVQVCDGSSKKSYCVFESFCKLLVWFCCLDIIYIHEIYGATSSKNATRNNKIRCIAFNIWISWVWLISSAGVVSINHSKLRRSYRLSGYEKFPASENKKACDRNSNCIGELIQ